MLKMQNHIKITVTKRKFCNLQVQEEADKTLTSSAIVERILFLFGQNVPSDKKKQKKNATLESLTLQVQSALSDI